MNKLKERWGITSNFQIVLILLAFSVNGSFAAYIAKPLMHFIQMDKESTAGFIYWPVRIVLIFVIYQITLVFVGTLFGQFKFFWAMEKKMLKRIGFKRFFPEETEA